MEHTRGPGAPTRREIDRDASVLAPARRRLPIVAAHAKGAWITDVEGRRYLDCLSGFSALNFGHANPRLLRVAHAQLDRLTATSGSLYNDQMGAFAQALARLCDAQMVLPLGSGADGVEAAFRLAREWGRGARGVAADRSSIVVMDGNYHGRTTLLLHIAERGGGGGPMPHGFRLAPFGDLAGVEAAMDASTVAVLAEPIEGEAGVRVPPRAFLPGLRRLCDERGALLILDEVRSGLCRTGTTFAADLVDVEPDVRVVGRSLGGGIVPLAAVAGRADVLEAASAGLHGASFGGNPLAAAIGHEVVRMVEEGTYQERARVLGRILEGRLHEAVGRGLASYRCVGLWAGLDVDPRVGSAQQLCDLLLREGVAARPARGHTVLVSPPLVVSESDVQFLGDSIEEALRAMRERAD